jgi:hypothetical protein
MSEIEFENFMWFMSSAEVINDRVAWIDGVVQHDAATALITYDLHEVISFGTPDGERFVRKNDMKYDTVIVMSYWDPASGTNWSPNIQTAQSGYEDFSHIDFVERGKRPRG